MKVNSDFGFTKFEGFRLSWLRSSNNSLAVYFIRFRDRQLTLACTERTGETPALFQFNLPPVTLAVELVRLVAMCNSIQDGIDRSVQSVQYLEAQPPSNLHLILWLGV